MTLFRKFSIAAVSTLMLAGSLAQANAMPLPAGPNIPAAQTSDAGTSNVTDVQYRRWHDGGRRGGWDGGRRGWYGGHQGYRGYRDGYRYHNGYWFPLAAFGAGALIGGAIASEPRYVEPAPVYRSSGGINPSHYQWCSERYRSYDSYSNTFQPNNGPRRTCLSPYY